MPTRTRFQGHPPKTCSEQCRKKRHRERERNRYHESLKHSEEWKAARAEYLKRRAEFLAQNPFEREVFVKQARLHTTKHREKVMADSEAWGKVLSDARDEYRKMIDALKEQPMGMVAYRFKKRRWYHSLSAEDKQRIYGVKTND